MPGCHHCEDTNTACSYDLPSCTACSTTGRRCRWGARLRWTSATAHDLDLPPPDESFAVLPNSYRPTGNALARREKRMAPIARSWEEPAQRLMVSSVSASIPSAWLTTCIPTGPLIPHARRHPDRHRLLPSLHEWSSADISRPRDALEPQLLLHPHLPRFSRPIPRPRSHRSRPFRQLGDSPRRRTGLRSSA